MRLCPCLKLQLHTRELKAYKVFHSCCYNSLTFETFIGNSQIERQFMKKHSRITLYKVFIKFDAKYSFVFSNNLCFNCLYIIFFEPEPIIWNYERIFE